MIAQLPSTEPVVHLAAFSLEHVLLVVLGAVAALLVLTVLALRGRATIRIGGLSIEPMHGQAPQPEAENEPTGPYLSPLSPEPTEPFNLAEINAAMRASETMRAIEALRAMETRLAEESKRRAAAPPVPSVRSIVMRVCPLCVLYEVSGSTPRCHIIPSDMRQVHVGRAPDNDVRCNQPNVSQHHFKLVISEHAEAEGVASYLIELEDQGSKNGTWINGKRIDGDERVRLADGDIIEAASTRYLFYRVFRGESC